MKNTEVLPYASGLLAGILVFAALHHRAAGQRQRLPPGPKPLPLLGNLVRRLSIR